MHMERIDYQRHPEPLSTPSSSGRLWLPIAFLILLLTSLAVTATLGVPLPPQPAESWTD